MSINNHITIKIPIFVTIAQQNTMSIVQFSQKLKISKKECESLEGVVSQYDTYLDTHFQMDVLECLKEKLQEKQLQAIMNCFPARYVTVTD